jgi:hypothetical protein
MRFRLRHPRRTDLRHLRELNPLPLVACFDRKVTAFDDLVTKDVFRLSALSGPPPLVVVVNGRGISQHVGLVTTETGSSSVPTVLDCSLIPENTGFLSFLAGLLAVRVEKLSTAVSEKSDGSRLVPRCRPLGSV